MQLLAAAPFEALSSTGIVALVLVYSASFFVKGIFGYGAVPILIVAGSFVITPHQAVVLAAVTNLMTHVQYMPDGLRHGQRGLVVRLAIFLLPAIAVGVWIFSRIDGASLSVVTGLIILLSILADAFGLFDPLAPFVRRNVRTIGPAFGTVAGLISGIVGAGAISFISLYVRVFAPDRQGFRATIILVTAVILVWRTAMLALSGHLTHTLFAEALLLLPPGLLAGWIGARVSRRISDRGFFAAYRAVIALGAGLLILRGLTTA
ncbi:sulfite exporter TauE/SafE family protein [Roseitranquillus sediminis]|uniref:sulfite exporter TauE/SafE family protein n=1 Tax=Roseitranquillus sediminis TaxID=2809051 RepID=UPI001D0BF709|nr:sulfite exporter TauE/SafE family protein [Roseitranquillus sediminis]MBM9593169.1 sulfite exporter TauE/SafE family protein [Roseitranquillus sediminis]